MSLATFTPAIFASDINSVLERPSSTSRNRIFALACKNSHGESFCQIGNSLDLADCQYRESRHRSKRRNSMAKEIQHPAVSSEHTNTAGRFPHGGYCCMLTQGAWPHWRNVFAIMPKADSQFLPTALALRKKVKAPRTDSSRFAFPQHWFRFATR